jgi:hypothetical protein
MTRLVLQAAAWLQTHLQAAQRKSQAIEVVVQQDPRFLNQLELAVRFGKLLVSTWQPNRLRPFSMAHCDSLRRSCKKSTAFSRCSTRCCARTSCGERPTVARRARAGERLTVPRACVCCAPAGRAEDALR